MSTPGGRPSRVLEHHEFGDVSGGVIEWVSWVYIQVISKHVEAVRGCAQNIVIARWAVGGSNNLHIHDVDAHMTSKHPTFVHVCTLSVWQLGDAYLSRSSHIHVGVLSPQPLLHTAPTHVLYTQHDKVSTAVGLHLFE